MSQFYLTFINEIKRFARATLLEDLMAHAVRVEEVTDPALAELADTESPQGIVAVLDPPRFEIESIAGNDMLTQRLMEMGLLDGEEIEVVGFAPLGDPMEILIRGYRLSLRKQEAARITVTLLDTAPQSS